MSAPKLRFIEFKNAWTRKKLETLLIESKDKSSGNDKGIVLTSSRKGLFPRSTYFEGRKEENTIGYSLVPKNSFTYRQMSDDNTFFINLNKDFELGLVSPEYPVFTTNELLDTTYFANYINDSRAFKQYCQLQKKGGTRTRLYFKVLKELEINIPNLEEQTKIGNFFEALNNKIQLQQEKVYLLKDHRRGYLQKIFSKRLCFKDKDANDFEKWKELNLFEIAEIYQPKTISQNQLSTTGFPVYGANGVIGFYKDYNHENEQIALTCRGNTCGTINYTKPKSWITGNAMVINVDNNPNINKKYLYYFLLNINFSSIISGSGQPQITRQTMSKMLVTLPNLEEQNQIANFLSKLDEKITFEQEKLELLLEQKKALMQQMFI